MGGFGRDLGRPAVLAQVRRFPVAAEAAPI